MLARPTYLAKLAAAVRRSPITTLLGPRQRGKTTLARMFAADRPATHFDLESQPDLRRLQNPELMLGSLQGLVVLDEIQLVPELFNVLRVLADRPDNPARFLILGSASPDILKRVSESLAGRQRQQERASGSGAVARKIGGTPHGSSCLRSAIPAQKGGRLLCRQG